MLSVRIRTVFSMLALVLFILGCGAPVADNAQVENAPQPADSAIVNETSTDSDANENTDLTPAIQHSDVPTDIPLTTSGKVSDFDSSKVLETKSLVGGDRFTFGRFERPFNANTMDIYFAELDIIITEVYQDTQWIYGRLYIKELTPSSSTAQYAIELDTNVNGKAEWLIVADKPSSTEWTVNGVRVYQDANQNVGGVSPALSDKTPANSDGFESLFFDQGEGENPDTAWVRISPSDPNVIEFALHRAAFSNPTQYLINFWAGRDLDPAKFDLNDAFTHEQAGAADAGLPTFYPIKAIAEIDNSCRMAIGFQPTGKEPGLCPYTQKQVERDPNAPPPPPEMTCGPNEVLWCYEGVCFCQIIPR